MSRTLRILVLCTLAAVMRCSVDSSPVAGGSSSTDNQKTACVRGSAVDSRGMPAVGAVVNLRPHDYVADTLVNALIMQPYRAATTVTDAGGGFAFDSIAQGDYRIEINLVNREAAMVSRRIALSTEADTLPQQILAPVASLSGSIIGTNPSGARVYAQIVGLERLAVVDLTGRFQFSDLPPGTHEVRIIGSEPDQGRLSSSVQLLAGGTADMGTISVPRFSEEDYSTWPHAARIVVNTAEFVETVTEDLHAVPLLIRLTRPDFPFDQAGSNGYDIRFAKDDGARLRYEIDSWDSAAGQAAVWVLMDTVYARRSDQQIRMFWGTAEAVDFSNSAAVFARGQGFAGVWHLGHSLPGADATVNRDDAIDNGSSPAPGSIGGSRQFDGFSNMSVADHASLKPSNITLSCWVKQDGSQPEFAKIVSKGPAGWPERSARKSHNSYSLEFRTSPDVTGFQLAKTDTTDQLAQSPTIIATGVWYHLAATFDSLSGKSMLYVNGLAVDSTITAGPIQYYGSLPYPLLFGMQEDGACGFRGMIDEAWLLAKAHSPSRIRFCYENQRTGSGMLRMLIEK